MDDNLTNDSTATPANAEGKPQADGLDNQKHSIIPEQGENDPSGQKRVGKVWIWMAVALILIVALIVFLVVKNAYNKKSEQPSLAEAVADVNAHTPALGPTMVLDSVKYDAKANRVTYYNAIRKGHAPSEQLIRDYYHQMSLEDLKVLQKIDFVQDYLSAPIIQQGASVRYVVHDIDGTLLKEYDITKEELCAAISEEEMKRASLLLIAQEAKSTQVSCPQQVDEATTITDCVYDSAAATITFTLALSRTSAEIDMKDFETRTASQKEAIIHTLAHDPKFTYTGVTIVYRYFDKNGAELKTIRVTPKEYLEHLHEHEHGHQHEHEHAQGHQHAHEHAHSH